MTAVQTTARTLACRAVSVSRGRRLVLDAVDIELQPGEWLGLIGPNGAGKSTLLSAMTGLLRHEGEVALLDGEPNDQSDGGDGMRPGPLDLALVPQDPILPAGMTVSEYIMLGRTAHLGWLGRESRNDRAVAADVIHRLRLGPFAGRSVQTLSGGETQRVVIARALAQQAPILLLDEPTSSLDIGHQNEVLELVDELRCADGLSVLAVMHDLTTAARFSDRLALLDNGRVVTVGRPAEVLQAELLSATYGTPLGVQLIDDELVVLPAPRRRAIRACM